MMKNKVKYNLSILLFITIFLTGCVEQPYSKLNVGTNVWPGYEPLYLAREKHFFDHNKFKLVELSSATQVLQAFRNEVIDAAAITLDEALLLLENGEQISIVLVFDISNGADAIIGQNSLNSFSDLKGKTIGIESTALGAYMLTRALTLNNMPINDIKIKKMAVDSHARDFLSKALDAVVTFTPIKDKLISEGGNVLFTSQQIPNEIVDVLVVRNSYLKSNPMIIQELINSWYQSLDFIKQYPEQALLILNKRMHLTQPELIKAYSGLILANFEINQRLLHNEQQLIPIAEKLISVMLEHQLLHKKLDASVLFPQKPFVNKPVGN
ncbi:MAG: ABC transporter substrate-binding protein [Gammaproteobacteria bacterium]|nr:ABC transporter substrate-binding protein [Gammaproteobacteria bacterium]